jgi:VanZ family protein
MQWHRILPIAAWAFLTFIAFATLSPFSLRPELTETEPFLIVVIEHVGAFGLLGLLFFISYPERPRTVALVILGSAVALELSQAFLPDRHARFGDALEKIVGGGAGIMLGVALLPVLTSPDGPFSRINQQWFGPKAIDSATRELLIGSFAIALFALALVAFQHLGR